MVVRRLALVVWGAAAASSLHPLNVSWAPAALEAGWFEAFARADGGAGRGLDCGAVEEAITATGRYGRMSNGLRALVQLLQFAATRATPTAVVVERRRVSHETDRASLPPPAVPSLRASQVPERIQELIPPKFFDYAGMAAAWVCVDLDHAGASAGDRRIDATSATAERELAPPHPERRSLVSKHDLESVRDRVPPPGGRGGQVRAAHVGAHGERVLGDARRGPRRLRAPGADAGLRRRRARGAPPAAVATAARQGRRLRPRERPRARLRRDPPPKPQRHLRVADPREAPLSPARRGAGHAARRSAALGRLRHVGRLRRRGPRQGRRPEVAGRGGTRAIRRRFNVGVPERWKASTLRSRPERRSLVEA